MTMQIFLWFGGVGRFSFRTVKYTDRPATDAPVEIVLFFFRVGRLVIVAAVFCSLPNHYSPSTILIAILRSTRRACSRDSESMSLALT
jgi:hypothetical protein